MQNLVCVNGKYSPIDTPHFSTLSRAVHFGDAIYETIFCFEKKFLFWDSHIDRLEQSAKHAKIRPPIPFNSFLHIASHLAETNSLSKTGYSFVCLTRGRIKTRSLSSAHQPEYFVNFFPKQFGHGTIRIKLLQDSRWQHPWIKSTSLFANALSSLEAQEHHALAVLVKDGYVTEGTHFNIFAFIEGSLVTPPSNGSILPGCTRSALVKCAHELNIPVVERLCTQDEILNAEALIGTSSLMHIAHVEQVDKRTIPLHPVTQSLREVFDKIYLGK